MILLHWLGGTALILLALSVAAHELTRDDDEADSARVERMALYGLLIGLPWAGVLFSGFFQLGSTMELPQVVIVKFIATMVGGILAFGVCILRGAGVVSRYVFSGTYFASGVLFGLSIYWGLAL